MFNKRHYRDLVRTTEKHAEFWWENFTKRGCSNNIDVDGMIILKWYINKQDTKTWTGFTQIRLEIRDGLVSKR
jgi:hypothetical protein